MMVKSRFAAFGFSVMVVAIAVSLLGLSFFLWALTTNIEIPAGAYMQLCLLLTLLLYYVSTLWRHAKHICIDTLKHTLETRNVLTGRKRMYYLGDFTGYIDLLQTAKGGTHRIIYLVRDKQYKNKMTDFLYSNLDELETALKPLRYLGRKKYSLLSGIEGINDADIRPPEQSPLKE